MSHHSGYSSASRMEIERLNNENEKMAARNAAEMAAQRAQMEAMQAILVANGLIPNPGLSVPQPAQPTVPVFNPSQPPPGITPSRKRHSSQQLGRQPKDSRVSELTQTQNRFDLLSQPSSYQDKSMQSGSMVSTPTDIRVQAEVHAPPRPLAWGGGCPCAIRYSWTCCG